MIDVEKMIRINQKIKTTDRSVWKKIKHSCKGLGRSRFFLMTTWLMMLMLFYSCASFNLSDHKEFREGPKYLDLFYKYKKIDGDKMKKINFEQIYDPSVRESNHSKIMYGNNDTAVILLHGFISSPFEVYFLANEINKSGFTVYLPLIEGFGGDIDFANATRYSSWQLTLKKSIEKLAPNYRNIVLVGFSMGGIIVTDFLLKNKYDDNRIQGAILLAPYFAPKWSAAQWLSKGLGLFSNSVSLKTIYRVSRSQDLIIPLSNQDYYNSALPIKAANELIKLGNEIKTNISEKQIYLPTLLVYTEDDKTINNRISSNFVEKHFQNVEIIKFTKNQKVRHQLTVPAGNKMFDSFCVSVINFIKNLKN